MAPVSRCLSLEKELDRQEAISIRRGMCRGCYTQGTWEAPFSLTPQRTKEGISVLF